MVIQTTKRGYVIRVRFPDAHEVCVMGRFNHWSTVTTPLAHLGDWVWEATLPLEAEISELGFFVHRQGERFGRLFQQDEAVA